MNKLEQIISRRPVVMGPRNTLEQAGFAMERNGIGSVVVQEFGQVRGVVTDRDLALALLVWGARPDDPLGRIVSGEVYGVEEDASIEEVIDVMTTHGVRRVPILRGQNDGVRRCIGVVTLDDLVRAGAIRPSEQIAILQAQLVPPRRRIGRARVRQVLRSQDRRDQAYRLFVKDVERETGLPYLEAESFAKHVLSILLHRLPQDIGLNFLSQLPDRLKAELCSEAVGPDRSITAGRMVTEVARRHNLDGAEAEDLLKFFWHVLEGHVSRGEMRRVIDLLPKRMREVFVGSIDRADYLRQREEEPRAEARAS